MDGNKGIIVTQMVFGYVEKNGTKQMSDITTSLMIEEMAGHNKGTMPHYQTMTMMGAYL